MVEPLVSIVVPVFRDRQQLDAVLASVAPTPDAELIVATASDADNQDLGELASKYPAVRWVDAPQGRGPQMNHGARIARGRWLLFLHADTRLSDGWLDEVRAADQAGAIGGSFAFRLDSSRRAARVIEWGVALRVRWLGLAYGDQAQFVRRDVFDRLAGFRLLPLMEDVDFIRRLKREGPLWHSRVPAQSSARRWDRDGWVRRSLENIWLVLWFWAGGSPDRLARRYYRGEAGWTHAKVGSTAGAGPMPLVPHREDGRDTDQGR